VAEAVERADDRIGLPVEALAKTGGREKGSAAVKPRHRGADQGFGPAGSWWKLFVIGAFMDFTVNYQYSIPVAVAKENPQIADHAEVPSGTPIDQHQAYPAGHSQPGAGYVYSIYANIYNRVTGAKLTHGIRGVFGHQGENNSGAAAPTGDWDYKSYQQYFVDKVGGKVTSGSASGRIVNLLFSESFP
jgi:hypothetical protein